MLDVLSLLVLCFWLSRIPHFLASSLRELPENSEPQSLPTISLIVAARDEAASIAASVRSLLRQDWPETELIVVDDRSSDGTSEILDQLAQEFPALQVIHNRQLPTGWIGKCWALHLGSQKARGSWLIFCDADVIMKPHSVRAAIGVCQAENYQHLCLAPRMISPGYWLDAVIFSLTFLFYVFQNPKSIFHPQKPFAYIGIGAFNMVRRDLYDQFGGHETLRLEVVDDVFLGMLAKRYGGRSAFFLGHKLATIEWYPGLWAYMRGLEKNGFAGLRFSWPLLVFATLFQVLIFFAPLAALWVSDGLSFWLWLASLGLIHALFIQSCLRQGGAWTRGLALYPALLIQFATFVRSAWVMTRQGGVVWRGSFYSLSSLKAAQATLRGPLIPRFGKKAGAASNKA